MIKKIIVSQIFLAMTASADTWVYDQKEVNGYITTYTNPMYIHGSNTYRPEGNSGVTWLNAQIFCALLGHFDPIFGSAESEDENPGPNPALENVVRVSNRGEAYYSYSHSDTYVRAFFCTNPISASAPSTFYSNKIDHLNGTFTIIEPRFYYLGEERFFTEDPGNWDSGHCTLFGGGKMVSKEITHEPETPGMDTSNWFSLFITNQRGPGPDLQMYYSHDRVIDYTRLSKITCEM